MREAVKAGYLLQVVRLYCTFYCNTVAADLDRLLQCCSRMYNTIYKDNIIILYDNSIALHLDDLMYGHCIPTAYLCSLVSQMIFTRCVNGLFLFHESSASVTRRRSIERDTDNINQLQSPQDLLCNICSRISNTILACSVQSIN
jgi:hypothetical protein